MRRAVFLDTGYLLALIRKKEERIKVALSFDEHFKQAGFEVPLLGR